MTDFLSTLKSLCELDGPSGREDKISTYILNEIRDFCDAKIDPMGNVIAFKKGKMPSVKKVMLDAHMDEVGVIITDITDAGFLKFDTVGGISVESLLCKRVRFENTVGVIGFKPVHQSTADERKKLPPLDSLYIDIGAESKENAEKISAYRGYWHLCKRLETAFGKPLEQTAGGISGRTETHDQRLVRGCTDL